MTDRVCGTGGWGSAPKPGDPDNNSVLSAVPVFGGIDVSWTYPALNPHAVAHTLLFRGTSDDWEYAVQHALVAGDLFFDKTTTATPIQYFYWIRFVSVNGTLLDPIGPVSATAMPTIGQVIQGLTGQIDAGQLATSLRNELGRIETLEIDLNTEVDSRISSLLELGEAINDLQGFSDETRQLVEAERLERLVADDAFAVSLNETITTLEGSIASMSDQLVAQFQDGISQATQNLVTTAQLNSATAALRTTLQSEYQAFVASALNSYETASDAQAARASLAQGLQASINQNQALVLQEQQARISEDSALAIRLDALSVKIDSLPVFSSGFEDGGDFTQWQVGPDSSIEATGQAYIGVQAALMKSMASAPPALGVPGGVYTLIPEGTATAFRGKRIQLRMFVRQTVSSGSPRMAVAYVANPDYSTGWQEFDVTVEWSPVEFLYDVPETASGDHYLAIWADVGGLNRGILVDAVTVEVTASDIPEFAAAITAESQARIEGDQVLASEITAMRAAASDEIQAAIVQEATVRASADDALASDMRALTARTGDQEAQLAALESVVANEQEADALRYQLLKTQSATSSAMVRVEEQARVTEDEALAHQITTLAVQMGEDISAAIQEERLVRVSAEQALAQQIDTLVATVEDDVQAAIQQESLARASADTALANQINTVQSQLQESISTVETSTNTQITRLDGRIDSTAGQITNVQASLGSEIVGVEQRMEAVAQGDVLVRNGLFATGDFTGWPSGWGQDSVIERNPNSGNSAIRSMPTRYALQFPNEGHDATRYRYGEYFPVVAGEDYVARCDYAGGGTGIDVSFRLYIQWRNDDEGTSTYQSVLTKVTNTTWRRTQPLRVSPPEGATRGRVFIRRETGGNGILLIGNIVAHRADAAFAASYTAKVQANGLIGGFGIYNDGDIVDAGFDVDRFWVGRTNSDKRKPFIIDNGTVYIDDAAIRNGAITSARIEDAAIIRAKIVDAAISSAKIADGAITNAKIANATIQGAKIANAAITSAKIASAAITTAKINNAAVSTLKIAGNAVTIPVAAFTSGSTSPSNGSWTRVQRISSFNAGGGITHAHITLYASVSDSRRSSNSSSSSTSSVSVRILRGGSVIRTFTNVLRDYQYTPGGGHDGGPYNASTAVSGFITVAAQLSASSSSQTIDVQVRLSGNGSRSCSSRGLLLLSVKR